MSSIRIATPHSAELRNMALCAQKGIIATGNGLSTRGGCGKCRLGAPCAEPVASTLHPGSAATVLQVPSAGMRGERLLLKRTQFGGQRPLLSHWSGNLCFPIGNRARVIWRSCVPSRLNHFDSTFLLRGHPYRLDGTQAQAVSTPVDTFHPSR